MAKRILVPLDLNPESESVLPAVADLARGADATVRLLHVAPVVGAVEDAEGRIVVYSNQETDRLEAEATDYLEAAARWAGMKVETVVRFGKPADEIVKEAETYGADLIVLAARPRGPFTRFVLGSTSEHVCHRTGVPVMIYRSGSHGRAG
jgi:nucleotide-binding universal stress UspA family protein